LDAQEKMDEWVSKDLLEQLVTMASLEKWVLRVFKDYLDRKDREAPREMAAQLEKMVFPEMLVRLVMLGFLVSQVCLAQLVLPELEVPMVPREMSDQLVLKASKVFLALKVQLESLEKRVLLVLLVSLERLDVLELAENVAILEREDQLESRDLKVPPDLLEHRELRVLLVRLETREKMENLVPKDCKGCLD